MTRGARVSIGHKIISGRYKYLNITEMPALLTPAGHNDKRRQLIRIRAKAARGAVIGGVVQNARIRGGA